MGKVIFKSGIFLKSGIKTNAAAVGEPPSFDDDFTGNNSDTWNPEKWINLDSAGSVSDIQNNTGQQAVPGSSGYKYCNQSNIVTFPGEFDIQVDFDATVAPQSDWWVASLILLVMDGANSGYLYIIGRIGKTAGHFIKRNQNADAGAETLSETAYAPSTGKLRFTRDGSNNIRGWHDDSGWVDPTDDYYPTAGTIEVRLAIETGGGVNPAATVRWDNLNSVAVGSFLTINDSGEYLLINDSNDKLEINDG